MKKQLLLTGSIILSMSILFSSCDKEQIDVSQPNNSDVFQLERAKYSANTLDKSINGDFEVRDGILHFKDLDSYVKIKKSFSGADLSKRLDFAQSNGFESQFSATHKALEKINNAKNDDEYKEILSSNSSLITLDSETKVISSKITDGCASALLNKDGLVYIGKILYKFTNDTEYIVYDGDKSKLSNPEAKESAELNIEAV